MIRVLAILAAALMVAGVGWGRTRAWSWCAQGGQTVLVGGQTSSTLVMRSYPKCLVKVYVAGTAVSAALYSDDLGTPLANPFAANSEGYWYFYADDGRYDVTLSGGGISTPFTLADIALGGLLSLNGLTGVTQTFTNDTNVTITSGGSAHVLGWTGTLAVPRGGTGASTLTANGVLLGAGTAAVTPTTAGAAYQPLRVPAGGGAPAFGALALNQAAAVTGTLGIANGGTGAATQTLGFDALSPTTAKGDLIADDGTNAVRVGVGTDGYALLADSGAAAGVSWGLPSLATGVTGTLPIANGGTGQTTKLAAMDALSPTTTKGDLLVDDGTNVVRLGVGTNAYVLTADSTQASGVKWSLVPLASGVSGTLPIANGGTSGATKLAAFNALSPLTTKGDLVAFNGTNNVRQAAGTNAQVLTADSTQAAGVKWATPTYQCRKDTVAYTNAAFEAASPTADVTLFTLAQYQKVSGLTVKHSAEFSDGGGAMTDVSIELGYAGSPDFYAAAFSIGEATPAADTTFLDVVSHSSSTMAAAGQAVLAHFTATGRDFGDGANTFLTGGSIDIWTCYVALQ